MHLFLVLFHILICQVTPYVIKFSSTRSNANSRTKLNEESQAFTENSNQIVEMSTIERISRAASFYSAALPVFASYMLLANKFKLQKATSQSITPEAEEIEYKKLHEWGSHLMTEKIKELRGFYVKTGQIISTRVDIFPEEYTSKLAGMRSTTAYFTYIYKYNHDTMYT